MDGDNTFAIVVFGTLAWGFVVIAGAFGAPLYIAVFIPVAIAALMLVDVASTAYSVTREFPPLAFGERYVESESRERVGMCVNCNSSDHRGVVTSGRRVYVAFGVVVRTLEEMRVEECRGCADGDLDWLLEHGESRTVSEIVEDRVTEETAPPEWAVGPTLDASKREQEIREAISGGDDAE